MKILNSIIVTLVLLSSAQVLAALNSNSNTDRILVTGDAKDNKARMGLGLPKNANLNELNPNPDIKTIFVSGDAKGNLTRMDLRFSKNIDLDAVVISNKNGILVGYCESEIANTTKDPSTDEWVKSIINGVTPKGATSPDVCLTNSSSGGLSLVGQIVSVRIDSDPELSGKYILCVNGTCGK
ncbi:hypothetical protein [uncultured Gammaproteobacteria bacterium]|jgi:hypothetical protein|nr:hypothetical protein [uncultured Gammaproteobacteria bacterium]